MNIKGKLIAFLILLVVLLFTWLMLHDRNKKTYIYADFGVDVPENYQVLGIDISHYQGEINWSQLTDVRWNDDSIGFVFIKCTEATSFIDDKCADNCEQAAKYDMPFGLYHFFRPDFSASEQAIFFAEQRKGSGDNLRPVIDVETHPNYSKQRLVDSVAVFLDVFEKRAGVRPIIYTGESYFNDYFSSSYLKYELFWIANYNGKSEVMESNDQVLIWQFSESATVNGISGKVDMNVAKPEFWEKVFIEKK